MTYTDNRSGRTLVKDGKWAVPPDQRPAGWESILPESATPILDAVIAQAEQPPIPEVEPDPAPAPPLVTVTENTELPPKLPPWEREAWISMRKAIEESAVAFGAGNDEDGVLSAAKIMVAGMWTRTGPVLRRMTGVTNEKRFVARCYEQGIWKHDDRFVYLGNGEEGDTELWLLAMAVAGILDRSPDGRFMFPEKRS